MVGWWEKQCFTSCSHLCAHPCLPELLTRMPLQRALLFLFASISEARQPPLAASAFGRAHGCLGVWVATEMGVSALLPSTVRVRPCVLLTVGFFMLSIRSLTAALSLLQPPLSDLHR